MSGARISFTCDTNNDQDLVAWLDSFGSRERGFAIKAAIRAYMLGEHELDQEPTSELDIDRLSVIEDKVSDIFREIVDMRRERLALSINNDIINNSINNDLPPGEVDPAVMSNIGRLFDD